MPKVHCASPPRDTASHAALLTAAPARLPQVERYHAGESRYKDESVLWQKRTVCRSALMVKSKRRHTSRRHRCGVRASHLRRLATTAR
eukprot:7336830-Alexandrium_andersonii.AAC.1